MNNLALISEQRDFVVSSSSLKDVRNFSREVFEKVNIDQDLKDELVLAIAEAAQNIVKHAYQNEATDDKMEIKISLQNGELEIGFFDKGRPDDKGNVRHRKIDDVKPGLVLHHQFFYALHYLYHQVFLYQKNQFLIRRFVKIF